MTLDTEGAVVSTSTPLKVGAVKVSEALLIGLAGSAIVPPLRTIGELRDCKKITFHQKEKQVK